MNGIRLAAAIALASTIALPQAASAQVFGSAFGPPATAAGIVVLADSYPGDLRVPCAKVVVTASIIGTATSMSTAATAVPGTTRKCAWQINGLPRLKQIVFVANPVPVADYNTATPTNVVASGKNEPIEFQLIGNAPQITLALVPSSPFPTAPPSVLTIVSGNAQTSQFDPRITFGAYAHVPHPFVVKLTTTAGAAMPGVPVTFNCPSDPTVTCALQGILYGGLGGKTAITVVTDTNGVATLTVAGTVADIIAPYKEERADGSIPIAFTAVTGNQSVTFSFTMTKQTTGLLGGD